MVTSIKILMTDDHPMILEGYQNTLIATKEEDQDLDIHIANDCEEAVNAISYALEIEKPFDILFIDIRIPPTKDGKITSGEDLAVYAKQKIPNAKIVILTMFNEPYRMQKIIQDVNPDGFLIKSDLTFDELSLAFKTVLNNKPFYSTTVREYIENQKEQAIAIDDTNREIIQLISQGIKMKHIAERLELSLSNIEKRKKHIKMLLDVTDSDGGNAILIKVAREKGLI